MRWIREGGFIVTPWQVDDAGVFIVLSSKDYGISPQSRSLTCCV